MPSPREEPEKRDELEKLEAEASPKTGDKKRPANAGPITVAGWGLALFGAARVLEIVLANYAMPAMVAQALIAEWGTARLGIFWTDPKRTKKEGTTVGIARRAGIGAAVGFVAAGLLFGLLKVTGGVLVDKVAESQLALLFFGLATACLHAMRDELLLHGIVLRALSHVESAAPKVVACGVTSAGAALGVPGATARSAIASGLLGMVFGALWIRDRGGWQALGAHAAWLFATSTLLAGGIVQSKIATSAWAGGDAGMGGGYAAVMVLSPLAILALFAVRSAEGRHISPPSRDVS